MPTYKPVGVDENSLFPPRVQSQLSATFVASDSVYLSRYVSADNTNAENRVGYLAAIADAEAGGKRLCYDGAFFTFEGEEVSSTATDMVHWASGWDTHLVTNVTRGRGVLVLAGARSVASGLHVDGANPDLSLSGVTVGGAGQFRYSVGVRVAPTAHESTLRNIRAGGFMCATVISSATPEILVGGGAITEQIRDCKVEGVYSDGCWSALQYFAPDGLTVTGLQGWYQDTDGSGGEGHIVYGSGYTSGGTTWYAERVSIDNCDTDGGVARGATDFAGPYKISRHRNLSMSNLRARNCPGLISVEYTSDFTIGYGVEGWADIGVGTAPLIQFFECSNGRVAPIRVESSAQLGAGQTIMVIARCTNVDFDRPIIGVNPAATATATGISVSGSCAGTRLIRPRIVNSGAGISTGVLVLNFSGDVGVSSDIVIEEPQIEGAVTVGVRFALKGVRLIFDAAKVGATTKLTIDSGVTPFTVENTRAPGTPYRQPRVVGWHNGEMAAPSAPRVRTWPSGQQNAYIFGNQWTGDQNGRITEPESGGRRMFASAFTADIDISVDVRLSTATRAGICLRASGDSTYLAVSRANGAVKIHKLAAGTLTELATAATSVPNGAFANLRAIVVGSVITVILNGVVVLSHTLTGGDETAYVAVNHGLYGDTAAAAAWENVIVRTVS